MKQAFEIIQVKPSIFLFKFKDYYDMAMHFLRYQEYYESSSPKFRGKQFEIFDFMRWYSKKYGKDSFTYPKDWGGYNIPSSVISEVYPNITDYNRYDNAMYQAYIQCNLQLGQVTKTPKFYIIGAVGNGETLKHEVAHGFFYTVPKYKEEMIKLTKELSPPLVKSLKTTLTKMGYTPKVHVDEIQAYMATGLADEFDSKLDKLCVPFIKVFKKYFNLTSS